MSPADILAKGAVGLAAAIARGETTASAATEVYLARIAAHDPVLRAFITVDAAGARAAAAEVDAALAAGAELGPLAGVPVAVKDNIAVAGLPCTAGVAARRGAVASADATVVARLRAAGAVILGTLNLHEGALGATTDNPAFGRCLNPWGEPGADLTPGGSSGGSGAAVAAGLCAIALGTDTMGSVRIPAAYCGVFGFKPTRAAVDDQGLAHLSWSLDHIGPLARSAEDLAAGFAVIAGMAATGPEFRIEGARIGVLPAGATEPGLAERLGAAASALSGLGADMSTFDLDIAERVGLSTLRRAGLLVCEAEGAVMFAAERAAPGEGLSAAFRNLLEYGARASAERLAGASWTLRQAKAEIARAMTAQRLDAVLALTAPQTAFPHDAPTPADQADFTCPANIADLPSVSVPAGFAHGLPVGVQIMGPSGADTRVLALAAALARAMPNPTLAPRFAG